MIKSKLFYRFALLGFLISAIMLIVSFFATQYMRDLIFDEPFRDRGPFRAVERIIENMNPADRVQGLRDLQNRPPPNFPGTHGFNGPHEGGPRDGAPHDGGPHDGRQEGSHDEGAREAQQAGPHDGSHESSHDGSHDGPPMGPPPEFGHSEGPHEGPPGFGGPEHPPGTEAPINPFFDFVLLDAKGTILFPTNPIDERRKKDLTELFSSLEANPRQVEAVNDRILVRRLIGKPVQYLGRGVRFHPPAPPIKHFALLMSIQLISIVIAVLLTLGAVLISIRQRALEAEQVIRDLSAGNLKARIPITKMDEVGQVMFSFNKMADEIEHLIEQMRKTEHARRDLLRELAHDLRTPVASLKSLIETVNERADQLSPEKRRELLDLAMREADYFEGLVDDLLFLGRVQEPKYKANPEKFDLRDMVRFEIDAVAHRYQKIDIELEGESEVLFEGDPGLMRRLIRNAIENAVSFAKSHVLITIEASAKSIDIKVSDDGPGFDAASLASFGQRKYSRAISSGPQKRISIGLGSVIMKQICDAYRGDLKAENRLDPDSRDVQGADVSIHLPRV